MWEEKNKNNSGKPNQTKQNYNHNHIHNHNDIQGDAKSTYLTRNNLISLSLYLPLFFFLDFVCY